MTRSGKRYDRRVRSLEHTLLAQPAGTLLTTERNEDFMVEDLNAEWLSIVNLNAHELLLFVRYVEHRNNYFVVEMIRCSTGQQFKARLMLSEARALKIVE